MDAILTAIRQRQMPQAQPVLVLSNLPEALGLTIAREKFGLHTEVLASNDLKGWEVRQECDDAASKIRNISNKWSDLSCRFHEIVESSIRLPLQK